MSRKRIGKDVSCIDEIVRRTRIYKSAELNECGGFLRLIRKRKRSCKRNRKGFVVIGKSGCVEYYFPVGTILVNATPISYRGTGVAD